MNRRRMLKLTMASVCLSATPALAADPRVARIAYLTGGDLAARTPWLDAFRAGLASYGYREGRNLVLDLRGASGDFGKLPQLCEQLLKVRPDVLVVSTTPGALAARGATSTVPIVFVAVGDPIAVGLVDNLARPGRNITGLTNSTIELTGKRLQVLKEALPHAQRVALMVNTDDPNAGIQISSSATAAAELGIELVELRPIRDIDDLRPAFAQARSLGAHAALRLVDPQSSVLRTETARLTLEFRLPVIYAFREDAEDGGMLSYGTSQAAIYRRAASFVHRILAGAKPGDLPVEGPSVFELVANLRTARALGIELPVEFLARADMVIE